MERWSGICPSGRRVLFLSHEAFGRSNGAQTGVVGLRRDRSQRRTGDMSGQRGEDEGTTRALWAFAAASGSRTDATRATGTGDERDLLT
jgi:hypothetical protein